MLAAELGRRLPKQELAVVYNLAARSQRNRLSVSQAKRRLRSAYKLY
jgi:hypothetical protein